MDIFTVKARDDGKSHYIAVNGTPFSIELSDPSSYQHAWRVANFLIENVTEIKEAGAPSPSKRPAES